MIVPARIHSNSNCETSSCSLDCLMDVKLSKEQKDEDPEIGDNEIKMLVALSGCVQVALQE